MHIQVKNSDKLTLKEAEDIYTIMQQREVQKESKQIGIKQGEANGLIKGAKQKNSYSPKHAQERL